MTTLPASCLGCELLHVGAGGFVGLVFIYLRGLFLRRKAH
jgi:hypothetical protein